MTVRNRLPPWHEELTLANGRQILIRPIRAEDAAPLQASVSLLQPEEIRQRYLHSMKELPAQTIEKLTRPSPQTEFVLVAAEPYPAGEALIGAVARVSIIPGKKEAEFAILVTHYVAGMGLGRHLMTRLVRWSKRKQLDTLFGDVLESNVLMLDLAKSLGFKRLPSDTPGIITVALDLKASQKPG